MTDTERWALNREIAERLRYSDVRACPNPEEGTVRYVYGLDYEVPDFAGDMNAALEMGERLLEMGLDSAWSQQVCVLLEKPPSPAFALLQAPAEFRARAAAEVLRERKAAVNVGPRPWEPDENGEM